MVDVTMDNVCRNVFEGKWHVHTKMGNLADDLKLWAEDIDEVEANGVEIECEQGYIMIGNNRGSHSFLPKNAIKFLKEGLAVCYTAMRRKEKK